jgi:ABC-type lipoprotein release transport system permease subunit
MRNFRIGFFLGWRQIQRVNIWTSILVITVVVFTVVNLTLTNGILIGITDGVIRTVRDEALGDIVIDPFTDKGTIDDTERLLSELKTYPQIDSFTARYSGLATIEANYSDRRDFSLERDIIAVNILGVDPVAEDETLNLSSLVTEGEYFSPDDRGYILIGKHYIDHYAKEYGDVYDSLRNIKPGSVVRVSSGTQTREFTVKGIINSKIDLVSLSVYIPEIDFRRLFEQPDYNASQIIVRLKNEQDGEKIVETLHTNGFSEVAEVELFRANVPKYVQDVTKTFDSLSIMIGSISIFVAAVTVFIIIFISTLSRRQHIGILKAVGINRSALQYAYMTQAAFYGLIGIGIGTILIYTVLIPYFIKHPIDFPYTDVELSVSVTKLLIQDALLFCMMCLAGLVPAWLIIRKNTLDSILGRK